MSRHAAADRRLRARLSDADKTVGLLHCIDEMLKATADIKDPPDQIKLWRSNALAAVKYFRS